MLTLQRSKRIVICISLVLLATSCAPAATPTPVPTPVPPTKAPQPTAVPPTAAPQLTTAPTTAAPPSPTTKPTVSGPPTLPPTKVTPTMVAEIPESADQIQRIKPEALKALIDGGADIVVVDNQPAEAYAMGHIKGAVNLPWEMQIRSLGGLPMNKLLVLYCPCAHEEDASDVAMQLITLFDYQKIMLLEGGWNRWVELGYPTEKGK